MNDHLKNIGDLVGSRIVLFEVVLLVLWLVSFFLPSNPPSTNSFVLRIIPILVLASLYFMIAFNKTSLKIPDPIMLLLEKLLWMSLSVGLLGILFKIQYWPNAQPMMVVSMLTIIIVILVSIVKSGEAYFMNQRMVLRLSLFLILGLVLLFVPYEALLEIGIMKPLPPTTI